MPSSMETGVKGVHITGTDGQVPMQQASQLTPQEKTLNAVSVGAGVVTTFTTNPIDMDGFSTIGIGVSADASHPWTLYVLASPDGSFTFGDPVVNRGTTSGTKAGYGVCFLNYAIIQINNTDTVAHTYNGWTRKWN